ncbi:MAG: HAD family hydrolase [Candidatus Eremiobacteraeota bacterium]|nr:HAD family hydrolase [Candidatus Eremiobacteraeota bacterium]
MLDVAAVGFDFDHTLGIDHRLERDVALEMLGGHDEQRVNEALAAFRSGSQTIADAMEAIGVDVRRFRELVLERAPRYVEALPSARDIAVTLQARGLPVAILSNGWSPLQELKAKLIGFPGPVLVSEVIGIRKPNVEAFRSLERVLGVPAARAAYVGDEPEIDVAGALRAGMKAVWFDWEGKTYPQHVVPPTLRISSLVELAQALPGPVSGAAKPTA